MINDYVYEVANIYAPLSFWDIAPESRIGKCGAGDKVGDFLVPETLWGLNVTFMCKIHDYMYAEGLTEEDREKADRVFRNNLMRWVNYKTKFYPLKWLRLRRASTYYYAVRMFGGPAFWNAK